jgi:hypothetical protein
MRRADPQCFARLLSMLVFTALRIRSFHVEHSCPQTGPCGFWRSALGVVDVSGRPSTVDGEALIKVGPALTPARSMLCVRRGARDRAASEMVHSE